jgi:hypothetical protein
MSFQIQGISPQPFLHLYGQPEAVLSQHGAVRVRADDSGYPDRVELREARIGEHLLLVNYQHQPAATPYQSAHAIYVLEGATKPRIYVDKVPAVIANRMISLRAFDAQGMMLDAELMNGTGIERFIAHFFDDANVAYLHAHFAKRGCFAARIDRSDL